MELICWGRRSSWREWCGDEGVEAACRGRGLCGAQFTWPLQPFSHRKWDWARKEGWFDFFTFSHSCSGLIRLYATCCFGFVCTVCVCTQCVALHILSVTCLLFAKLFCCKIGQIEKHGRSLCGFHGLYKDAYKLHYEHFVILHQKRLIETLRFFLRRWGGLICKEVFYACFFVCFVFFWLFFSTSTFFYSHVMVRFLSHNFPAKLALFIES